MLNGIRNAAAPRLVAGGAAALAGEKWPKPRPAPPGRRRNEHFWEGVSKWALSMDIEEVGLKCY